MTTSSLLLLYCLLSLGLAASLFLFFSLKREIQSTAHTQQKRFEEIAERLRMAEEDAPRALLEAPAQLALPPVLHSGFNLNKRVHAMRLLRRGEDVAHIAAALAVPRAEVELLIRVQKMTVDGDWPGHAHALSSSDRDGALVERT